MILTHARLHALQVERSRAFCEALELCLDRIHAVRVDAANNKLRDIAPVIREHGVEYERSHFRKKLLNGSITLERTEKWIKHTLQHIVETRDQRVSLANLRGGSHGDFERVFQIAMVSLVVEYPHWGGEKRSKTNADQVPETLLNDLLRIKALNAHFHTDVTSAAILITVDQEVKARMRDGIVRSQLLKTVSDTVVNKPPKPHDSTYTIKAVMEELGAHLEADDVRTIKTMVEKHVKRTHPVYIHLVSSALPPVRAVYAAMMSSMFNMLASRCMLTNTRSLFADAEV